LHRHRRLPRLQLLRQLVSNDVSRVQQLAQEWNGRTWQSQPITSLSSLFSNLYGITCPSRANCTAVGEVTVQRALAAHWNGTGWTSANARNPLQQQLVNDAAPAATTRHRRRWPARIDSSNGPPSS
jgi:hypothetical protein